MRVAQLLQIICLIVLNFDFHVNCDKEKRQVGCPDGFTSHAMSCYKLHIEKFTWPEAYSFCKALNSHLVKAETKSEFDYLKQMILDNLPITTTVGFYVGATDAMVHTEYKWAESYESVAYLPWAPGQPEMSYSSGEDCLALHKEDNGDVLYHDYPCADRLNFICEIEKDSSPAFG